MTVITLITNIAIHYPDEIGYYVRQNAEGWWICTAGIEKGYNVFSKRLEGSWLFAEPEAAIQDMKERVKVLVEMLQQTDREMVAIMKGKIKGL